MKKVIWFGLALIVLIAGGGLAAYLMYFNAQMSKDNLVYQEQIAQVKVKQTQQEQDFANSQKQKANQLAAEKSSTDSIDSDGDGLTYAQERTLGTEDNNKDSDGDGIFDNSDAHPAGGGTTYKISVDWQHKGLPYRIQFGVPEDQYAFYKSQPRGYCCSDWEKFATPHDPIIQGIAKDITDISLSTGETCKTCLAIDFVESMIYQKDIDYNGDGEYPKYPIETIVDERGDCEDTSFLMASILEALNIDTILFSLPGHMAVGVYCTTCSGEYYAYNGRNYYFLETTQNSGEWKLGQIGYSPTLMRQYNLNKDIKQIIDVR